MRVLYVSHTAQVSGGERSLLDLLRALPPSVQARAAAPRGRLTEELAGIGVESSPIAGTTGSLRPHPIHTPLTLAQLAASAAQVARAARRHHAEVLHANSIRAGLILALGPALRRPSVVHVRDVLPPSALSSATLRLIGRTASTVIANSRYTADAVLEVAPRAHVEVVHNAVDLSRFDPDRIDRAAVRGRLLADDPAEASAGGGAGAGLVGSGANPLLLGVVAQLSPWKGQDTAIRALALLREQGIEARLLLIGTAKFLARATRFDNETYVRELHTLAHELGVEEHISWLGEREDVQELIAALDVLLLPSWEEPFGRAVIEAMALRVPVLATAVGGPPEILLDGRGGEVLPPREPAAWAGAIAALASSPARRAELGRAGRERVERSFALPQHAAAIVECYERSIRAA